MNDKEFEEIEEKFTEAKRLRKCIEYHEKSISELKRYWKNRKSLKLREFFIGGISYSGQDDCPFTHRPAMHANKENYNFILNQAKSLKESFEKELAEL